MPFHMHKRVLSFVMAAAMLPLASTSVEAAVIASYDADPDNDATTDAPDPTTPTGGGWVLGGGGAGAPSVTTTPGNEVAGVGPAYWEVNDAVTNGSKLYNISAAAGTPFADALINDGGWRITFTLKVLQSANPTITTAGSYNAPTVFDVRNGARIYDLAFVNDGTNEAVYHVPGGTTFNETNKIMNLELGDVYHTFEMVYDKAAAEVEVFLDGGATPIFTFTNSNTGTSGVNRVLWGTGLQGATQQVRWQDVTFETIPEPASIGVICAAGLLLTRRRPRTSH